MTQTLNYAILVLIRHIFFFFTLPQCEEDKCYGSSIPLSKALYVSIELYDYVKPLLTSLANAF